MPEVICRTWVQMPEKRQFPGHRIGCDCGLLNRDTPRGQYQQNREKSWHQILAIFGSLSVCHAFLVPLFEFAMMKTTGRAPHLFQPRNSGSTMKQLTLLASALLICGEVHADVIIIGEQVGDDVIFTWGDGSGGNGFLDVDGLSPSAHSFNNNVPINPSQALIQAGADTGGTLLNWDGYLGALTGPASIGTGDSTQADSSTIPIAIAFRGRNGNLFLEQGTTSSTAISGNVVYENHTFTTLGLDTASGPYTWTFTTAAAGTDSITLQFQTAAVPEPSSFAVLGFGAVGFLLRRRRQKANG